MRTFDYKHLPRQLFDGKVGDANVRLHEDKGKLELLQQTHGETLANLRDQAHFDNVEASTRIEGFYVDSTRVRELVAATQPSSDDTEAVQVEPIGETEAQIVGYARALRDIERDAEDRGLSTASILQFYETLYAYRNLGRKSRYRKKDYLYVQVDGHMQAMPVSPITAFETPLVLGGACDSLADAFSANTCSPLILNAVFTVDFLCIRPFEEGNGRISRLFSQLMLTKAGFDIAQYVSIDRIIEGSAMDYYDALNACVEGWDRARNDYEPFALYWLDVVHQAYEKLFAIVEQQSTPGASKSERVRAFVLGAQSPVTKRQLRDALPDISEATIEAALGALVKEGAVEKVGAGRSTAYRAR